MPKAESVAEQKWRKEEGLKDGQATKFPSARLGKRGSYLRISLNIRYGRHCTEEGAKRWTLGCVNSPLVARWIHET